MTLTKDQRTGHYRASFRTANGKRRTLTTRTSNRAEAVQIVKQSGLRELETAARIGRLTNEAVSLIATGSKITMTSAVAPWLDWLRGMGRSENLMANSSISIHAFMRAAKVEHVPPMSVTHEQISLWLNQKSDTKASSRSVMLSAVRSFFHFCSAKGWTIGDPSQLVEVNMGKLTHAQKEPSAKEIFTYAEVQALMAAAPPESFWRAAIGLGRWTGLRLCDIASLEWASLTKPGRIIVWTQKRDRRVELPLEPEGLQLAVAAIKQEHKVWCFPKEREIIIDHKKRSIFSVQFRRLCDQCGIEGKSFHCLRHTFITEQDAAGIPIEHISRSVGHINTATTQGYIHKPKRDLDAEIMAAIR